MSERKALCDAGCSEACSVKASAGAGCVIETGWYAPIRSALGCPNIDSDPSVQNFSHRSLSIQHLFRARDVVTADVIASLGAQVDVYRELRKRHMAQGMADAIYQNAKFDYQKRQHVLGELIEGSVYIMSPDDMDAFAQACFDAGVKAAS